MTDVDDVAERIGNDEREAAVAALKVHLAAGRIDALEYEDRSLQARQARTWEQMRPIFADLPEPRPAPGVTAASLGVGTPVQSPGSTTTPAAATASASAAAPAEVGGEVTEGTLGWEGPISADEHGHGGLIPEPWAWMVVALTPFVALLLFFITNAWEWFLAIPISGIVVYGPDREREKKRRRRDRRR